MKSCEVFTSLNVITEGEIVVDSGVVGGTRSFVFEQLVRARIIRREAMSEIFMFVICRYIGKGNAANEKTYKILTINAIERFFVIPELRIIPTKGSVSRIRNYQALMQFIGSATACFWDALLCFQIVLSECL